MHSWWMNATVQCMPTLKAAHQFRSKFIDSFVDLERWSIEIWRHLRETNGKTPPHLGNRLKYIRDLAQEQPSPFAAPADVTGLLAELKPYCDLRKTLVHGRLETASAPDGETFFIVENAMSEAAEAFKHRVVLRGLELNPILARLGRLVKAITKQALA